MAYSETKLKSNGDKASPCFRNTLQLRNKIKVRNKKKKKKKKKIKLQKSKNRISANVVYEMLRHVGNHWYH
jgi:hypothetical protein